MVSNRVKVYVVYAKHRKHVCTAVLRCIEKPLIICELTCTPVLYASALGTHVHEIYMIREK